MSDLFLIAAVGRSGQLGLDGKLPWHDAADLRWFKTMTTGGTIIVGHNTAQGLPELPDRTVVVDDRSQAPESILEDLRRESSFRAIYVAGGAKTYRRYLHLVTRHLISVIDYDGPADTWMPPLWGR